MLIEKYNDLFATIIEKVDFDDDIVSKLQEFKDDIVEIEKPTEWESKYNALKDKYIRTFMKGEEVREVRDQEKSDNQEKEVEEKTIEDLIYEEE